MGIKFEIWDIKEQEMFRGDGFSIGLDGTVYEHPGVGCSPIPVHSDDFIVRQFTGLKDKNGAEIFAGDIIEAANYDIECVSFKCFGNIAQFHFGHLPNMEFCDVIGNIYENPELVVGEDR